MTTPFHPGAAPVSEGDVLAGKYVVERVLGVGGMGVVVAARHQLLGGRVALKFVLPQLVYGDESVQRFLREAQAATQITSEHVARVTDVGILDYGAPYMVMEYLEGKDLASVLEQRGPLPLADAVDYLLQALQAVAEAHAKGIVHRDLKPSNLFLTKRADGSPLVKVLDFGIAKAILESPGGQQRHTNLTTTQGVLGSPLYMSPEQIRSSKHVDARSDVWAIGIVLHELLSRKHPFTGDNAPALLAAISADPPLPLSIHRPDVPQAIERLILGCLEKDRERRIASVAVIAEHLERFGSDDARLSYSRIRGVSGHVSRSGPAGPATPAPAQSGVPAVTGGIWAGTVPGGRSRGSAKSGRLGVALVVGALALAAGSALIFRSGGKDEPESNSAAQTSLLTGPVAPPPVAVPQPEAPKPIAPGPSSPPRAVPARSPSAAKTAVVSASKPAAPSAAPRSPSRERRSLDDLIGERH